MRFALGLNDGASVGLQSRRGLVFSSHPVQYSSMLSVVPAVGSAVLSVLTAASGTVGCRLAKSYKYVMNVIWDQGGKGPGLGGPWAAMGSTSAA